MADNHLSDVKFADLSIHPKLMQGIEESGFVQCTPIQALSLPVALQGKDVSGQAQTGTGKTAAFLIATFNRLLEEKVAEKVDAETSSDDTETQDAAPEEQEPAKKPKTRSAKNPIRALILAPTRELAIQIHEDAKPLSKYAGISMALAYGGTDYDKQRSKIEKGVDVLIGTPGRVIDYFKQRVFSIEQLEVIVLDEADRMFDLGFIADVRYLFRRMPKPEQRLNMLFSATLSHRVAELAYEHMNEPTEVKVEAESVTADKITEIAFMPANDEKIPLLLGILGQASNEKSVVFTNTKRVAETVQAWLQANNFKSSLLSGDVPQKKRERLLNDFKSGKTNVLVATDVAARGLHIPDVTTVINHDLPNDAEDYVHRIGRTARAGESGTAISLICETYAMNMLDIETYTERTIPVEKAYDNLLAKELIEPDLSEIEERRRGGKDRKRSKGRDNEAHRRKQDRPDANSKEDNRRGGKRKKSDTASPVVATNVDADLDKVRQQIDLIQQRAKKYGREIPAVG